MVDDRLIVLIILGPEDPASAIYLRAIENVPFLPRRIELRFATTNQAHEIIHQADIVVCQRLSRELLRLASKLRWISFLSAGFDGKVTTEIEARRVLVTNSSGAHAANISEHLMGFILMLTHRMPRHLRAQMATRWQHDYSGALAGGTEELYGQTLGIVGLGRIGEALAIRGKAFGMRIIATKRNPDHRYDPTIVPDALYPAEELRRLLAESDHVCICVPLTKETRHMFNTKTLSSMKPNAYLYNISRGQVVDESALISALENGSLAGAGLDVFETEPLSPASPLWHMDNVLITPHIAGQTSHCYRRAAALFVDNLERYLDGRTLHNLYDSGRGY